MRLLDQIVQRAAPFLVQQDDGRVLRLSGAGDYAARIGRCPLRYVLSDELTRDCTALAYSEGTRLADCLDLVHVPAREWWMEWNDAVRAAEFRRVLDGAAAGSGGAGAQANVARAGVYVSADAGGRSGLMRKFWSSRDQPDDPLLAPLAVRFDLDAAPAASGSLEALLCGAWTAVPIEADAGAGDVLRCARYRFDADWLDYYRAHALDAAQRHYVLRESLGAVAVDLPVVIALLLMMTVRDGLPQRTADLSRLNAKRARSGKPLLLEHIELCSPLVAARTRSPADAGGTLRRMPRFHHVRGHLVRRANAVFWRTPHWRGHLRLGQVRSRTVTLHA